MHLMFPTVLLCCSVAAAQTFAVSPKYEASDAPGAEQLAGLGATFRQQILISAARLAGLKGKEITGMAFRRDAGNTDPFAGGIARLAVQLSKGPADAAVVSSSFSTNQLTKPTTVFTGNVSIPGSPMVASTNYDPWGSQNSFYIRFSTTYKYSGAALCIDLVGTHAAATGTSFWFVDFEYDRNGGKVVDLGTGCKMKSLGFGARAYASAQHLRIGSTAQILALGRRGTSALLILGALDHKPARSLAHMGASGCFLYVQPVLAVPVGAYSDFPFPGMPAYMDVLVQIPVSSSLMGSRTLVQFANNETMLPRSSWTNPAGMTTSNGLALTISAVPPSLGMSMVRSYAVNPATAVPGWGIVDVSKAPVIRFTYK